MFDDALYREIASRIYRQSEAPLEPKCCGFFCYKQATPLGVEQKYNFNSVGVSCL